MFQWLKRRRRKKILQKPFPTEWRNVLEQRVVHYSYLSAEERVDLEKLIQIFVAEKNFEGCNDQVISDEIRVIVAAQACLLILQLPHDFYAKVSSILIYPSTVVLPTPRSGIFTRGPLIARTQTPIAGQAFMHGTVILVWDAIKRATTHPGGGHNVVYHEFAHILDMFDGRADGTPLLDDRSQYKAWAEVCTRVFYDLRQKKERGKKTFLNKYGATNEAEFFAVATEYFFDRPLRMQEKRPQLYKVLKGFYRQDTAERQRKAKERNRG